MAQPLPENIVQIHDDGTREKQLSDKDIEQIAKDYKGQTQVGPLLGSVPSGPREIYMIIDLRENQVQEPRQHKPEDQENHLIVIKADEEKLTNGNAGHKELINGDQASVSSTSNDTQKPENNNTCQETDSALSNEIMKLDIDGKVDTPTVTALQNGASDQAKIDAAERNWIETVLSKDYQSEHVMSSDRSRFLDISMHKDGRVILCNGGDLETNGYLHLYDTTSKSSSKMKLGFPFSAVQIDPMRIAVSITCDSTIQIVKVHPVMNKYRMEKSFTCKYPPGCLVALQNGNIAVSWNFPPAFGVIDVSGTEIKEVLYVDKDSTGRKMKFSPYIAVDEICEHVFQSCAEDKAMYCFNFAGEPVFTYTHRDLQHPSGVAVTQSGNVILCDHTDPGRIHVVSYEGKTLHVFTGVPSNPLAVCIDANGSGIWVTQASRPEVVVHCNFKPELTF